MVSRMLVLVLALVVLSGGYLVWDHFTEQQRVVEEQRKVIEEKTRIVGRQTRARRGAQAIVKERSGDRRSSNQISTPNFRRPSATGRMRSRSSCL